MNGKNNQAANVSNSGAAQPVAQDSGAGQSQPAQPVAQDSGAGQSQPAQSGQQGNENIVVNYDAFNFWDDKNGQNNNQQQQAAAPQKKPVPPENQIAMYQRLLDKTTKQLTELQEKFNSSQGNNQQRQPIDDLFNSGQNQVDKSMIDIINQRLDEKFSSIEEQNFYNNAVSSAERYISKVPNLPAEIQDKFLNTVQQDTVMNGLRNGLIGFEDVYKILTYDSLLEKLNSLSVSARNKGNLNVSAGGGATGGEMNDASLSQDFFVNNPDKALDPDFVMEYKKKKGLF